MVARRGRFGVVRASSVFRWQLPPPRRQRRNAFLALAVGLALAGAGVALAQDPPEEPSVQPGERRVRHRPHPDVRYYKPGNGACHVVLVEADTATCEGSAAAWQRLLDYEKQGIPAAQWSALTQFSQHSCPPKDKAPDCVAPLRWAVEGGDPPHGPPLTTIPLHPGCRYTTSGETSLWCPDRGWVTPEELEPKR